MRALLSREVFLGNWGSSNWDLANLSSSAQIFLLSCKCTSKLAFLFEGQYPKPGSGLHFTWSLSLRHLFNSHPVVVESEALRVMPHVVQSGLADLAAFSQVPLSSQVSVLSKGCWRQWALFPLCQQLARECLQTARSEAIYFCLSVSKTQGRISLHSRLPLDLPL